MTIYTIDFESNTRVQGAGCQCLPYKRNINNSANNEVLLCMKRVQQHTYLSKVTAINLYLYIINL